jgi:hypothetical protein
MIATGILETFKNDLIASSLISTHTSIDPQDLGLKTV